MNAYVLIGSDANMYMRNLDRRADIRELRVEKSSITCLLFC